MDIVTEMRMAGYPEAMIYTRVLELQGIQNVWKWSNEYQEMQRKVYAFRRPKRRLRRRTPNRVVR